MGGRGGGSWLGCWTRRLMQKLHSCVLLIPALCRFFFFFFFPPKKLLQKQNLTVPMSRQTRPIACQSRAVGRLSYITLDSSCRRRRLPFFFFPPPPPESTAWTLSRKGGRGREKKKRKESVRVVLPSHWLAGAAVQTRLWWGGGGATKTSSSAAGVSLGLWPRANRHAPRQEEARRGEEGMGDGFQGRRG